MSQDLHLKASDEFLAEGSSFLANMYCTVQKISEKYKSQENGKEKTELRIPK